MKKSKALLIITIIYILAFAIGAFSCVHIENTILKFFVFDTVATVVTFVFSVLLSNSSVYDAYWSLTPMLMSVWLFAESGRFSVWHILFLIVFNIWSARLTLNWVSVFTDFSYEDWRYRKFRDETPKIFWPAVNFFGIHYMPTVMVFLGMLPMFSIFANDIEWLSVFGFAVMLMGVVFEHFADKQMHEFLKSTSSKGVCQNGLWKYSRHPNYLGEITFWLGVYLSMLPYDLPRWYYCVGFISIYIMFNVISIPLMEKRQLKRRQEYYIYRKNTSRLLILPNKRK